jgi:hypothetical protein
MTEEKVRHDLADVHGQSVQIVSSNWVEDPDGNPQGVERVVETAVLFIPDCLRDDVEEEDMPVGQEWRP